MKKLTDKEFVDLIDKTIEYVYKDLRYGQSFMCALNDIKPDLYKKITNTNIDPFYDDNIIPKFISFLNSDSEK